ncbi:hypothetical protein [Prevotella intermedia]|uniref:hypothetical protein n=1 Tax=Prevotella intermedia TaxID=28131 RepID=UPI000BE7398D|nr:hypothetical protein [Prevotella intermedia]PDP81813.1 hypothetical protein CLI69_07110 [Prevotella intermedia]
MGKRRKVCKYFSQAYLWCNFFIINALQNLLFCVPKAAVLHGKSVGFASQNSRFRNAKSKLAFFNEIIFTKIMLLSSSMIGFLETSSYSRISIKPRYFFLAVERTKPRPNPLYCDFSMPPYLIKTLSTAFPHTTLGKQKKLEHLTAIQLS